MCPARRLGTAESREILMLTGGRVLVNPFDLCLGDRPTNFACLPFNEGIAPGS